MNKRESVLKSRDVALSAAFAAAYAAGVTLLAPISFSVYQVRVADILLPLSIVFGPPAIVGLTLGNVIGNLSSPFGIVDIVGGTAANLLATLFAWVIGRRRFRGAWLAATVAEIVIITLIVGTYLAFLIGIPLWASWAGVLVGEAISVGFGGYLLLRGVDRALRGLRPRTEPNSSDT
jgi:uncharacterized membrane protein